LLLAAATPHEKSWANPPQRRASETVADDVYLQEVGRQIPSTVPLTAVAVFGYRVFAGSDQGLFVVEGQQLIPVAEVSQPIRRLSATDTAVWAIANDGLHRLQDNNWHQVSAESFNDLTTHLGEPIVASERRLWRVVGD